MRVAGQEQLLKRQPILPVRLAWTVLLWNVHPGLEFPKPWIIP